MSRKVKEDDIDIDAATEEAKEAESEQADVETKAEKLSAKAVRDIIFPEIGDKAVKAEFAKDYDKYTDMSDEGIVLAYREFYKKSMAKKVAPKKEVYKDPALKAPVAVAQNDAEETAVVPVAEAKEEAIAAPTPVGDEKLLKEAYMASVNELISSLSYSEDEKKEFVKSLHVEALSADDVGVLITSVVGKLAAYHTANAEADKKAAEAKAAQESAVAAKPQRSESYYPNAEAPKASRGYRDVWEGNTFVRHYDDGRPDDIINKIAATSSPVKPAAKPQQYVAPTANVAATPIIVKPVETKPQNSFVSGGNKIIINADGTVSVQAERKPVKPTQKVLMNLKGGTQLVLMATYINHGGRLASGYDYEIPNKGSVKVEAVDGGFNETVTWTDGGTKESFYPAVKVVGVKLSDRVIKMTQVPDGITDEGLAKLCKAIGSVIGQKLSDQTLCDIAKHLGEEAAWSFVKPIIFNKTK